MNSESIIYHNVEAYLNSAENFFTNYAKQELQYDDEPTATTYLIGLLLGIFKKDEDMKELVLTKDDVGLTLPIIARVCVHFLNIKAPGEWETFSKFIKLIDTKYKTIKDENFKTFIKKTCSIFLRKIITNHINKTISMSELIAQNNIKIMDDNDDKILNKVSAPPLYDKSFYEATSSCILFSDIFSLTVARKDKLKKTSDGFQTCLKGSLGNIYYHLKPETPFIEKELEYTFKILNILTMTSLKSTRDKWLEISGKEIINLLKHDRDYQGKKIKLEPNLNWLATHLKIIRGLDVWSEELKPASKDKQKFTLTIDRIFHISFDVDGDKNLFGEVTNITDIKIKFRPGEWYAKFYSNDPLGLHQFGYLHRHGIEATSYTSNLLNGLAIFLQQHQPGDFTVLTLLTRTGFNDRLQAVFDSGDRNEERQIFKTFNLAIHQIRELPEAYSIEYKDLNCYPWLEGEGRKPRGWFRIWLYEVIKVKKPKCLEGVKPVQVLPPAEENTRPSVKPRRDKNTTQFDELLKLLDETKVSKTGICKYLGKSPTWLTKKIARASLTDTEIRDCIKAIGFLTRKP